MKKQLTLSLILLPFLSFAQGVNDTSSIIGFIFILAISIGIFLLFRGVMLWYWKVNELVKNQHDQLEGMKVMISKLDQIAKNTEPIDQK